VHAAEDKAARLTKQARAAGQELTEKAEKDTADYDAQGGQCNTPLSDCTVVANRRADGLQISVATGWCFCRRFCL
jgi:hypothetical protein